MCKGGRARARWTAGGRGRPRVPPARQAPAGRGASGPEGPGGERPAGPPSWRACRINKRAVWAARERVAAERLAVGRIGGIAADAVGFRGAGSAMRSTSWQRGSWLGRSFLVIRNPERRSGSSSGADQIISAGTGFGIRCVPQPPRPRRLACPRSSWTCWARGVVCSRRRFSGSRRPTKRSLWCRESRPATSAWARRSAERGTELER